MGHLTTWLPGLLAAAVPSLDEHHEVDLAPVFHDELALTEPMHPLCRPDCAGLCPVCGESLNGADPEAHRHERGGDLRMAKLRELKLDE